MIRISILSLATLLCLGCANVDEGDGTIPVQTAEGAAAAGPADAPFKVLFETTKGNFTVEVHPEWAPNGAAHFRELVEDGFYDGCGFFRAVPNFMVQWGIAADPKMTAKWEDSIQDDPVIQSNKRGYMTFAQTGQPNSRSTQLFINFGDNVGLDTQPNPFPPIGKVVGDGMKVVDSINKEYGEPPRDAQMRLTQEGNAYLKREMPNVDFINKATIVD
ncbi:MAG: peptidylprolyl isomerase [Planctomycetaceae bacterium]